MIKKEKKLIKQQYKEKYITDQSKLDDIKFGTTDMAYAGCELIAIYNAILLKGKNKIKTFNEEYLDTPKTIHGKFKNLLEDRPFIIAYQVKG